MDGDFQKKLARLDECLRTRDSLLIAFSGGLDSAALLQAAVRVLGRERVLAVTARSPSVPQADLAAAAAVSAEIGAKHEFLDTAELDDPRYAANPAERCYYCKLELFARLRRRAAECGLAAVACGTNADDFSDFRPGLRAADEHGVCAPLAEAGLTKADVRRLAELHGLSIADKPASPCLASRIPYGEPVTAEKLRRIDAAERILHELGFRACRVRHHGDLARIEVPAEELERLATPPIRTQLDRELSALGFRYVTLDLRGLRTGSLNEALPLPVAPTRAP